MFTYPIWRIPVFLWCSVWLPGILFVHSGFRTAQGDEPNALSDEGQNKSKLRGRIRLTLVDEPVIHYATFQSHNQKVVEGRGLIFMTHLRTRNEAYTAQTWRLSVSGDAGGSFATLTEQTDATNPPVLECDPEGNLYLIRVDFQSGDAFMDRWDATPIKAWLEGRQEKPLAPKTTRIPGGAAGKYSAIIDPQRDTLYFFSHNNTFHRLRTDGTLIDSRQLITDGPNGLLQYPHLSLNQQGKLYLAWTTQKHGEYLYWDIHHCISEDGGDSFFSWLPTGGGKKVALEIPIVADDYGPALRVTLDDEFHVHTWLASGLATEEHWHGLYLAQTTPPRQHYIRYDLRTGRKQIDRSPEFAGQHISLRGLDGFFARDLSNNNRLFVVGNESGHLACLVSDDAGETWQDYFRSEQAYGLYSIGGFRQITHDGALIGSFTDQQAPEQITDRKSKVYFFRIEPQ